MNFLDENGLVRLWTHIVSRIGDVIKKEDIAGEVTETEENPVSGAAIHQYVDDKLINAIFADENGNINLNTGSHVNFSSGRISISDLSYTDFRSQNIEMFMGQRGLRVIGTEEEENDAQALTFYTDRGAGAVSSYNVYHDGNIIYSETEPSNPVEGTIWLVPPASTEA